MIDAGVFLPLQAESHFSMSQGKETNMQKQQPALKSLKRCLCLQSQSGFPARNPRDPKPEPLYLRPVRCVDLVKDTVLGVAERTGIAGEAEGWLSRLGFASWGKGKA